MTQAFSKTGSAGEAAAESERSRGVAVSSAARATIDTILQSSAVELFHTQGIAVAPLVPLAVGTQQRFYDWVGLIGFDTEMLSGTLTVSVPPAILQSRDPAPSAGAEVSWQADWVRELANQLLGRVKNRLSKFQVVLRTRLPTSMSGSALELHRRRTPSEMLYRFRALRGDILVVVDAPLQKAILVYSAALQVAKEGDVILF